MMPNITHTHIGSTCIKILTIILIFLGNFVYFPNFSMSTSSHLLMWVNFFL